MQDNFMEEAVSWYYVYNGSISALQIFLVTPNFWLIEYMGKCILFPKEKKN